MLAKNMQGAADQHHLPFKIAAFSSNDIGKIVENDAPDCMLLGPQVRFLFDGINERYGKKIPVAVIDSGDYGSLNGERVLKLAILEMKRHQVDVNADK